MKPIILILTLLYAVISLNAQDIQFRENIDKDSLFMASLQKLPINMQEEFAYMYYLAGQQEKEYLLFMISMPQSSKKELIENLEKKKSEILKLKTDYQKLVPQDLVVYVEFYPESKVLTTTEEISIRIYQKQDAGNDPLKVVAHHQSLKPNSDELHKVLKSINWTPQTLDKIKTLLSDANCVSIINGTITTIGFAPSGMGKYSYIIFNKPLNPNEIKTYNNGCEYIFYKDNLVLEYIGGDIGAQCFERE